ncbi:MAG: amidase [Pseudomonadota bacterium]
MGHSTSMTQQRQLWSQRLHAFVETCDPGAAGLRGPALGMSGELSGLSCGVKDIIDVMGIPTRNGSDACRDTLPAKADAAVVAGLRDAGARIVAKTVTTEFAFTDPTDCRNPYDLARSPGGSSSGSGAAVGAGIIDLALGTQTAGSLCRPAAYCGAVGLKPTFGVLPTAGVTPLAPSFDTVGVIARSVDLAAQSFRAMCPAPLPPACGDAARCSAAALLFDATAVPTPDALAAFDAAGAAMSELAGPLRHPMMDIDIARVVSDHRVVMNSEAFAAHGHLLADDRAAHLKPRFRAGLEAGKRTSAAEKEDARGRLDAARADFWAGVAGFDVLLTLPVPEGAPLIGETTGFQDWLTPWTVFGGPLISLPWGLDSVGRPCAVMLAGHPGADTELLTIAAALEQEAPPLPPPALPDC